MFKRVYSKGTVVAENKNFLVKIYIFPKEGGSWHVHFVRKSDGSDVKIGLWDFELKRPTKFDRKTVIEFQKWVYENRSYLRRKWFQNVIKPQNLSKVLTGKRRKRNESKK